MPLSSMECEDEVDDERGIRTTGTTTEESSVRAFMAPLLQNNNSNNNDEGLDTTFLNHDDDGIRHRTSAFQDIEHPPQQQQQQQQAFQDRHRILDRSGDFRQSRGRWGVERLPRHHNRSRPQQQQSGGGQIQSSSSQQRARRRSFSWNNFCCFCFQRIHQEWGKDWFFWLAYQKTCFLFLLLFVSYLTIVCFFGFIYLGLSVLGSESEVNPDGSTKIIAFCNMDINDHMEAMYFSLSTMTTIGYGVSDYYFGGCYSPLLVVLWQVCTGIVFDAVAVGLIFHRISRGAKRTRSILFSDKAVVRRICGVPYLMFRLGERRKYHLIEATIRVYCIRHERLPVMTTTAAALLHPRRNPKAKSENGHDQNNPPPPPPPQVRIETSHFVSRQMRLHQPDDRYGSQVWMGLPQVIVHRIDGSSPLMPSSPVWYDAQGIAHNFYPASSSTAQHSITTTTTAATTSLLSSDNKGVLLTQELLDPLAPSESSSSASLVPTEQAKEDELASIYEFLTDRDAELVVLVEGTDEGTGAAIQARHSYKTCDIVWNSTFAECVYPYNRRHRRGPSDLDPVVSIDFSKFHDTVPAPIDCDACAHVVPMQQECLT